MTDVERRELRERIATVVMGSLYASNNPQLAGEPAHVLAFMAVDAADALIAELDEVESE